MKDCTHKRLEKYDCKIRDALASEDYAFVIAEIKKIRPLTLRRLLLVSWMQNVEFYNDPSSFVDHGLYSLELIQEVLGCSVATAYDFWKTYLLCSILKKHGEATLFRKLSQHDKNCGGV